MKSFSTIHRKSLKRLYHFSKGGEQPKFGLVIPLSEPGFVGLRDYRDGWGEVVGIKLIRGWVTLFGAMIRRRNSSFLRCGGAEGSNFYRLNRFRLQ